MEGGEGRSESSYATACLDWWYVQLQYVWFPLLVIPFYVPLLQLSGLEEALEYCELEKKFASQNAREG